MENALPRTAKANSKSEPITMKPFPLKPLQVTALLRNLFCWVLTIE